MTSPVRDKPMLCLDCGYDLRACTRYVCPECGREFTPFDPATFARRWPTFIRYMRRICIGAAALPFAAWPAALTVFVLTNFEPVGLLGWLAVVLALAGLVAPVASTGAAMLAVHFYKAEGARAVRIPWLLSIAAIPAFILASFLFDFAMSLFRP